MARTPSAEVVSTILEAAGRVLAAGGPSAVTPTTVAVEAGVSVQTIYNRFGSMDEVLDDLAIRGFRDLAAALLDLHGDPLGAIDDPLRRLAECLRRYRRFATDDPERYRLLFDGPGPDGGPSSRTGRARLESLGVLVAVTRMAFEAGVLLPGRPEVLADRLWAAAHGAILLELAGVDRFDGVVARWCGACGPGLSSGSRR